MEESMEGMHVPARRLASPLNAGRRLC